MAAAPVGADNADAASQAQAQAQHPEPPPGPHMLARTVLPPTVFTRAVAGSFTGSCPAAAAAAAPSADPPAANTHAAAAAAVAAGAPEPTEVVLASATSLLLVRIWPFAPAAADSAAAAPNHAEAGAAAMSEDGSGCSDGEAAREVLCEQPAFGAIVAIAACRQPLSAVAQDAGQDLLLMLLAHSPQLLALRFDASCARFVPVARIDCRLAGDPQLGPGDPRAGPARLAVAPGGAAVAVAPRRGNPMVLLPAAGGGFSAPTAVPISALEPLNPDPAAAQLREACDLAPAALKPPDILSMCFADCAEPTLLVLGRVGGSPLRVWRCWLPGGDGVICTLLVELVVVGSWPSSSMRCVPPHVFPATPFAIDAVPGVPNGMLLLTPFEARAIGWGRPSGGVSGGGGTAAGGSAVSMQSLRLLARWRLDSGDAGEVGFAEAKRAARQLPPRGLCAAWAWDALDQSPSPAAAAQQEPGSSGGGGSDSGNGSGNGSTWMAMDVPANLAAAGLPAALAMAGLGGAGSSSGWQQEARKRALALPCLLVVDSEGRGKRCGPDGVHGAAVCAEGRPWWLLALRGGTFLASSRDGGADLLTWRHPGSTVAGRQRVLRGGGCAAGGMLLADLAGLGQPQGYTVHKGRDPISGSLRVAYPRPVPEVVFESGPDYGGVTGLWALAARPGEESHAAVVLSFVSGSRTLSIAGAELTDATEAVALAADECTIAAGCIGDLLAAQVTAAGIRLCSLAKLVGIGAASSGGVGSADVVAGADVDDREDGPRPGMGKRHASWATMEGIADTFASRLVPFSDDMSSASPSWRRESAAHSLVGARSGGSPSGGDYSGGRSSGSNGGSAHGAFSELYGSSISEQGGSRGLEDVWQPPGAAAISVAVVVPGYGFYSCAGGKVVHAVAVRRRSASSDGGSGSGKRKRSTDDGWRLASVAAAPVAAELSCMHAAPAPGITGGLLVAVGTHEPAVEVLLLRSGAGAAGLPMLGAVGRLHLAPPQRPPLSGGSQRRHELLSAALGVEAQEGGSSGATPNCGLPESVLLLPPPAAGRPTEVLVGLRSGAMLRAALQPAAGATGQPPNEVDMDAEAVPGGDADMADAEGTEAPQPQQPSNPIDSFQLKQVGHAQWLGSLPVGLVPLPASGHQLPASGCRPPPVALVLAERPCIVRRQPGAGFNAIGCEQVTGSGASGRPDDVGTDTAGCGGGGGGGGVSAQGLPTAEAVCAPRLARAVALTLPAEEPRTLVLGASSDGRLRLLDVAGAAQSRELALTQRPAGAGAHFRAQRQAPLKHAARSPEDLESPSWRGPIDAGAEASPEVDAGLLPPLRPAAVPSLLAAQPLLGLLLVAAVPKSGAGAPLVLAVRPTTGEVLAQCALGCDEEVTALAAWPTLGMPFPLPGFGAVSAPTLQHAQSGALWPGAAARTARGHAGTAAPVPAYPAAASRQGTPAGGSIAAAAAAAQALFGGPAPPQQRQQTAAPPRGPVVEEVAFVAVGTSCTAPPPLPWHAPGSRRGRLLLLRLRPPADLACNEGWRLVVEEVLQLGEPVARLAPAAAPGMLLAGVGSGLAAYRLVRRRVRADRHAVCSVDAAAVRSGGGAAAGRSDDDDVSSRSTGPPQQHGPDAEAAARRRRRQMHLPPPPPAQQLQQLLPPAQQPPQPLPPPQQQQYRRRRQPLPEHLAAAAIAAAIPAGDREAGWAFEARRRAVRKLPGGSGSFDGISDGAAGGGGSSTTEELPPETWLMHWGLARHCWRRLPAPPAALHVDPTSGAVAVADGRDSVRVLDFDPLAEPPFTVLRADCVARDVVAAAALPPLPAAEGANSQPPPVCVDCGCAVTPPDAACVAAADLSGCLAVLAPDTTHRGPEANLRAAATFNMGCPAAAVVPGSFALDVLSAPEQPEPPHGRDAAGDAAPADMELPADAGHLPSSQTAVRQDVTDSQASQPAFLAAATDGALLAAASVPRRTHALLAALEAAMAADEHPLASPLPGERHAAFRVSTADPRAAAAVAPAAARMADGDLLAAFLQLPEARQQDIVSRALEALERSQLRQPPQPPLPSLPGAGFGVPVQELTAEQLEADTRLVAEHVELLLAGLH